MPELSGQAGPLAPRGAAKHVGEKAMVCGLVVSAKYASQSGRHPTFLDFVKFYPDTIFAALILGTNRPKFGTPENAMQGKGACVTGEIKLDDGKPESS